ncbi:MAG: 8-amino-7-oxononanoate synthase, partial [Thermodesulfobacteriota bacterium]
PLERRGVDADEELEERGLRRETWPVDSCHGALISIQGRPFINFASNNYLGLAQRGEVREAAEQAIRDFGWGSGASRLMSGTHRLHEELEARLA